MNVNGIVINLYLLFATYPVDRYYIYIEPFDYSLKQKYIILQNEILGNVLTRKCKFKIACQRFHLWNQVSLQTVVFVYKQQTNFSSFIHIRYRKTFRINTTNIRLFFMMDGLYLSQSELFIHFKYSIVIDDLLQTWRNPFMRRFTFPHTLTLVSINHKHWNYEYAYSQSNTWTKNKCWHVLAQIY